MKGQIFPPSRCAGPPPSSLPEPLYRDPISIGPPLIPDLGGWPHRLLHVNTMTSHVRSGFNTYNGVQAPRYNIMSYTWGHYEDRNRSNPSLLIRGISWPLPCIEKEHFTPEMFLDVIHRVARGVDKERCDWVWVDVACIPQEWAGETSKDAALRGQEIGRQVEIFQRAEEFFAWLCSIQEADIIRDHYDHVLGRTFTPYLTWQDVFLALNEVELGNGRWKGLHELEAITLAYERYMKRILGHPWFQSLWTLQEMVLRSNGGYILLDDNGFPEDSQDTKRMKKAISLYILTNESEEMELLVLPRLKEKVQAIGGTHHFPHDVALSPKHCRPDLETIYRRLEDLTSLQKRKGLIGARVTVPHTVYFTASLRRVTHLVDRIYGIVQVYGINCNPNPKGNDQLAKLHALEDEFGMKLVQKAPVLSQLFLHSSADEIPRRSWLITQKCHSEFREWYQFDVSNEVEELFEVFSVLPGPRGFDTGDILLRFCGKAWSLGAFIDASVAGGGKPTLLWTFDNTSCLISTDEASKTDARRMEDQYGLKLDDHISKSIFGHVVRNFPAHAGMHDAIYRVFEYYDCPYINGREELGTIVVALLGCLWIGKLPSVVYFGPVLVCRDSGENAIGCHVNGENSAPTSREIRSTAIWERIGLFAWHETYHTRDRTPHELLPPAYMFQCSIV